ncbi:MAG: 30S ribosome-binding factor RbfA [Actinobacteria bacterium]|nr:30S ribosome-binding factor RbfA [Actinomycetota bacterium]MCL6095239.1 30S ribosome-binding factor RbfA [Actinomycetota bacterium]
MRHAGSRRLEPKGQPAYPRVARVNAVVREVVAQYIERLSDTDDRLGFLTVTGAEVTGDLSHATVYMSSLPLSAKEALEEQRKQLQAAVARETRMKRTPQLRFEADPAIEAGWRVEAILRHLGRTMEQAPWERDNP